MDLRVKGPEVFARPRASRYLQAVVLRVLELLKAVCLRSVGMAELQQLQNVAIGSLGLRAVQLSQDSRLCLLRATARKN